LEPLRIGFCDGHKNHFFVQNFVHLARVCTCCRSVEANAMAQ
jgi:hypothetical protein